MDFLTPVCGHTYSVASKYWDFSSTETNATPPVNELSSRFTLLGCNYFFELFYWIEWIIADAFFDIYFQKIGSLIYVLSKSIKWEFGINKWFLCRFRWVFDTFLWKKCESWLFLAFKLLKYEKNVYICVIEIIIHN